ncbi:pyruvate carboxylase subunit B [Nocardioides sp. LHG3406-4]|uniref:pyruvate carboxylase subunit B n=1 Tax=Nocardioides sp. LHG3406-4 TaxID=2804575 RepID=UPI003CF884B1
MSNVGLIDTSLRDGNQSLWATRMTTDTMLPILPVMDRAGYHSIEMMATVNMDVCVRFLGENPWDRIRLIRRQVRQTPLRMMGMAMFFSISRVYPDEVVELFNASCARAGIEHMWITAANNDVRTAEVGIRSAREAGLRTEGSIQFTVSPVHTDEFFAQASRDFIALGVDALIVKDAGGLLTPERAATLIPALKAVAGDVPIYVHSHCITGLGPAANLASVEHGASAVWTASTPLANGPSLPADASMARSLAWLGHDTGVDHEALEEISAYFTAAARREGRPLGQIAEYDPGIYVHQMPGGMLANFKAQLEQVSMGDRLDAVLEEMPRVRQEMGYPNVQTPFSQFIGTQALLNVIHGRYEIVPDEIRKYALGYWGRTPAPIDPDVFDRVSQGEEPVTERPGALVPPILDDVRREHGPFHTDEDLLMATLFMPDVIENLRGAERAKAQRAPLSMAQSGSIAELVREASRVKGARHVRISLPG